ncbi:MAG: thioredoxin [Chitinophagales bacterium]|nr:thioredoxin [Chitinophagales bacterium]
MAFTITNDNFQSEVLDSKKVAMVDFWAEWCGPCRMVGPIVEELSNEYEGKALVGKCDVDEYGDVAAQFGIRSIPTILFFKNGELVDRVVGAVPKAQLKGKLDGLLV